MHARLQQRSGGDVGLFMGLMHAVLSTDAAALPSQLGYWASKCDAALGQWFDWGGARAVPLMAQPIIIYPDVDIPDVCMPPQWWCLEPGAEELRALMDSLRDGTAHRQPGDVRRLLGKKSDAGTIGLTSCSVQLVLALRDLSAAPLQRCHRPRAAPRTDNAAGRLGAEDPRLRAGRQGGAAGRRSQPEQAGDEPPPGGARRRPRGRGPRRQQHCNGMASVAGWLLKGQLERGSMREARLAVLAGLAEA
jgi:hypothetical protein